MLTIPVHATVIAFDFSIVPHVTITAGSGVSNVPGFIIFFIWCSPKILSEEYVLNIV